MDLTDFTDVSLDFALEFGLKYNVLPTGGSTDHSFMGSVEAVLAAASARTNRFGNESITPNVKENTPSTSRHEIEESLEKADYDFVDTLESLVTAANASTTSTPHTNQSITPDEHGITRLSTMPSSSRAISGSSSSSRTITGHSKSISSIAAIANDVYYQNVEVPSESYDEFLTMRLMDDIIASEWLSTKVGKVEITPNESLITRYVCEETEHDDTDNLSDLLGSRARMRGAPNKFFCLEKEFDFYFSL